MDDKTYREGRRRLKELKGKARAEARKSARSGETRLEPYTVLGQRMSEVIRADNLDALVVYEDGPGRWYGDLVLRNMPVGMPTALGTPSHSPRASRRDAARDAYFVLIAIYVAIDERERAGRDTPAPDERIFELHGYAFHLPGEAVEQSARLAAELGMETYTAEDAIFFFESRLFAIPGVSGEDFDPALVDAATDMQKAGLIAGMALMLLTGQFRYPERRADQAPGQA